jgi:hypothetical protein
MKRRSLCGFGKADGEVNRRSFWAGAVFRISDWVFMMRLFLDQVVGREALELSFWAVNLYQPLGRVL